MAPALGAGKIQVQILLFGFIKSINTLNSLNSLSGMKTFQKFILDCELIEGRTLKGILGPGSVSDYSSQHLRSPYFITKQQRQAEDAMREVRPIRNSSYSGRVESGRPSPPGEADDPNYQGPLSGLGASQGTRDRMPGTTPSSSPRLPPSGVKNAKPIPLTSSRYKNNYI